jgi:hypothetical protein
MTAAALQLKLDAKGKPTKAPREQWQPDAWDMYDLIPEVSQAVTFMANVVSGVRLFIAERLDDNDQPPVPAGPNVAGAAAAREILDRLRTGSASGGVGGLLAASVHNLKVTGDYWLLGEPARDADPLARPPVPARDERWEVRSIDEVRIEGKRVTIKDAPGDRGRVVQLPPDNAEEATGQEVFLLRVWDRHPRFSALARSSLRAALNQCDELLLLSRCVRVGARRYLAGNGMLAVPSELDLPASPDEGDEGEDPELTPLMRKLATAMIAAMADESNPDSLVPLMTMGPADALQKLQHIKFGADLDAEVRELVDSIRTRLGAALDLPIEQLTGIAKVNHWGAWQIDGASWARYGQPTTRLIVDSWTEGLLWPQLIDNYGVAPEAARRLVIWFDPADAVMDPDASKTADELFDRAAISWDAYRRRKGANDDEAPSPEELEMRRSLGLVRGGGRPGGGPVPNDGEAPEDPAARGRSALYLANEAAALVQGGNGHRAGNGNGHHRPALAAAGGQPLGQRLMQIDRTLRVRLEEAAEAALRRALQAAGARVRSRAQRAPNIAAAVSGVAPVVICQHLGAATVAALELSDDDLLAGALDDLAPRFDARVTQAQRRVRAMLADEFDLDESELDELARTQDRDRNEAWVFLSGALFGLARQRLYDPAPTAPVRGEVDASSSVPTGVLREAVARAGGGSTGGDPVSGPAGGVATGETVLSLWARHGRVVGGWEWTYGDPGSRSQSFPAHEALDGVQFAHWSDAVLLVDPDDSWLGVTHYRPGDHVGCQCDFVPLGTDEVVPTDAERLADLAVG